MKFAERLNKKQVAPDSEIFIFVVVCFAAVYMAVQLMRWGWGMRITLKDSENKGVCADYLPSHARGM